MMSNDEKKKINVQEIKKYWLEEALEALNVADHLYKIRVKSAFDPCSKSLRVKGRLDPFFRGYPHHIAQRGNLGDSIPEGGENNAS